MENNKLIAEFMDVDYVDVDTYLESNKELKYHKSWDWLDKVVEKIERLGYSFEKNYQPIDKDWQSLIVKGYNILFQEFNVDSLKSSYKVVVEFIKWYNKK